MVNEVFNAAQLQANGEEQVKMLILLNKIVNMIPKSKPDQKK